MDDVDGLGFMGVHVITNRKSAAWWKWLAIHPVFSVSRDTQSLGRGETMYIRSLKLLLVLFLVVPHK